MAAEASATRADLVKALRAATDRHQRVEESHRQRLERLAWARHALNAAEEMAGQSALKLEAAEEMANQSALELEAANRDLEAAAVAIAGGVVQGVRP